MKKATLTLTAEYSDDAPPRSRLLQTYPKST
jgi:hypothetical protein